MVEVGRANLEFEKLDLDDKTLAQIAAETGGRYVHLSTAVTLIDQLDRTQRQKSELHKTELYRPPGLFWALFVGAGEHRVVLAAEVSVAMTPPNRIPLSRARRPWPG